MSVRNTYSDASYPFGSSYPDSTLACAQGLTPEVSSPEALNTGCLDCGGGNSCAVVRASPLCDSSSTAQQLLTSVEHPQSAKHFSKTTQDLDKRVATERFDTGAPTVFQCLYSGGE